MKQIHKIIPIILTTVPLKTYAHVKYIANQSESTQYGGFDLKTILSPISEPKNIALLIIGALTLYLI
ncbi:MAG: hypothetical protein CUN55_17975, partial [Phototrophicales bacterium]